MHNTTLRLRQRWIRLTHWEYWPFHLVNFPAYVYWAWLSLKARSWFFVNTANPLIRNGGFLMESKKEIYDFLCESLYPKTVFVHAKISFAEAKAAMQQSGLTFPLIAKPDIGMRGLQVAVVRCEEDLAAYASHSEVDFLLQELIEYENEAGIFYVWLPNEKQGKITGIVGKEFLSVVGDGVSTIAQLLLKNSRAVLQWQALQEAYGEGLDFVLTKDETFTLVPFGNHSRGSKFVDWSDRIDEELTETFNRICKNIPEFYYGRMDVRFRSWDELKQGKNFSIIELNGAGSEPTHIYDPKHSIFFAWKEIIRHLRLLYRISKQNKIAQGLSYMTTKEGLAMLKANSKHVALISKKTGSETTKQTTGNGHRATLQNSFSQKQITANRMVMIKRLLLLPLLALALHSDAQTTDSTSNKLYFLSSAAIGLPSYSGLGSINNGWQFASGLEYKLSKNSSLAGDASFDSYGYKKSGDGYNLDGSVSLASLSFFYKQRFGQGRWHPFLRVGGGGVRLSLPTVASKSGFADIKDDAEILPLASGEAGLQFNLNQRYTFLAAVGHQWLGKAALLNDKPLQTTGLKIGFLTPF